MLFEKNVLKMYQKNLCMRYDGSPLLRYFSVQDFPGLLKEPFSFLGNRGQKLQGYFYFYNSRCTDRLVIFDHGIGGGHDSYMKEIEVLARHGYTVFAYDHTGCKESEGENIIGFAQSLCDLDHAVKALRANEEYREAVLSVVGHSWGGFATLNIPKFHPDIQSCVAFSGFIGVERMMEQQFGGIMKAYRKTILNYEKEQNPVYATVDARDTLQHTDTRVLVIHSEDDAVVKSPFHFDTLQAAVNNPRVTFLKVNEKGHNPNYTKEAVRLLGEMSAAMTKGIRKKEFATAEDMIAFRERWDWDKITEQDMSVWQTVFAHLDAADV